MVVLLVLGGLAAVGVALWVLVMGRLRWLGLRSRRSAAVLAAASLALLVSAVAVAGPGAAAGAADATTPTTPARTTTTAAAVTAAAPTPHTATATAVRARPRRTGPTPATRARTPAPRFRAPTPVSRTGIPTRTAAAPTAAAPAARAGTALAALATLAVKGRAARTGYDRAAFGPAWADVAGDGCDTRDDVLRRDLTDIAVRSGTDGCEVATGVLADPYSGTTISFTRGVSTSALVQIDHVVPLSNAWQTGAARWSATTREAFANDPLELLAVDGSLNEQKSDGDAATWLPPNHRIRCAYVARQVAVKARYALWVTPPEQAAIARVLASCPGQALPTEAGSTPPAPDGATRVAPGAPARTAAPEATPTTTTIATAAPVPAAGLDPRYPTCGAAEAAGYGPYRRGVDPEYAWYRDGDSDGTDCE